MKIIWALKHVNCIHKKQFKGYKTNLSSVVYTTVPVNHNSPEIISIKRLQN